MSGRTVKRVALDFDWPLNERWKGYLNPHYKPCPEKGKTCWNGATAAAKFLEAVARMLCTAADDAMKRENHPWFGDFHWMRDMPDWFNQPEWSRREMVELVKKLTGEEGIPPFGFLGRDHEVYTRILKQTGLAMPEIEYAKGNWEDFDRKHREACKGAWGICQVCLGNDLDPACKEACEAWKEEEPPAGPGWQLWETVTEGSPISPVFRTARELAAWCAGNATIMADEKLTNEEWLKIIVEPEDVETASMMVKDAEGVRSLAKDVVRKRRKRWSPEETEEGHA